MRGVRQLAHRTAMLCVYLGWRASVWMVYSGALCTPSFHCVRACICTTCNARALREIECGLTSAVFSATAPWIPPEVGAGCVGEEPPQIQNGQASTRGALFLALISADQRRIARSCAWS